MKKFVLLFLFGLILNNVFAQHSVTLKQVTLDSLRPRVDMIHVKGDMNVEDTLYLQDTSIYDVMQRYVTEGTVTIGTSSQIAFVNPTATDLGYSANFEWNDTTLSIGMNGKNSNIFIGVNSGETITTGGFNTFLGYQTGQNTNDNNNTFLGYQAGKTNTTGSNSIFIGSGAGELNTSGDDNVFIGYLSGQKNTTSVSNVFIGKEAGNSNLTGNANTFIGNEAGEKSTTAGNTFIGYQAGTITTSGSYNVFLGWRTGYKTVAGASNTYLGTGSGYNSTGNRNVFIGLESGYNNIGDSSILIGHQAGYSETNSNKLYIENSNSTTPLIWGDFANDSVRINGDLDVTQNITVDTITALEVYNKTKSHGFFAFEDSAVVINCTQDNWAQVTNATNTLFHGVASGNGFDLSGDTITFSADARVDLEPHIILHWGIDGFGAINEDYEVRIYNIDNTAGIVRKAEGTTTGANNRIEIGTTSYDINSSFGDRYILQIMNKTNSNDFTIENGSIYIEVSHY